jgi:ABC-2 type transport system permease protein
MSAQTETQAPAPGAVRPFFWSVRRELWENRAIYLGPAIAAAVVVAGIVIAAINPPHFQQHGTGHQLTQAELRTLPYDIAALLIMAIGVIIGVFYSLGALHNERRDRSVLFWKSLPVSDRIAVGAKALIPFVVLPACVFVTIVVTHVLMLALHLISLAVHGEAPGVLLTQVPLLNLWLVLAWGLFTTALWWAPVYGWLFMVSAWARRMTFLWAVAPPIALSVFERLAFGTTYIGDLLGKRVSVPSEAAFAVHGRGSPILNLPMPDPVSFFSNPGLWAGLLVGAGFFAAAIWLRRRADPI